MCGKCLSQPPFKASCHLLSRLYPVTNRECPKRHFLQNFYAAFPTYESRDFALFTESYGGHYGPEFSEYFLTQNAAIDAGTVSGEKINLIALGINNGWIDPLLQYQVRCREMLPFVEDLKCVSRIVLINHLGLPHLRLQQHLQPACH